MKNIKDRHRKPHHVQVVLDGETAAILEAVSSREGRTVSSLLEFLVEEMAELSQRKHNLLSQLEKRPPGTKEGQRFSARMSAEAFAVLKAEAEKDRQAQWFKLSCWAIVGLLWYRRFSGGRQVPLGKEEFRRRATSELEMPSRWEDFRQGLLLFKRAFFRR